MCKVFARHIGTAPPQNVKVIAVNEPVEFDSDGVKTVIKPGDYIVADANGVVVLPSNQAEAALEAMAAKVDADTKMAAEIKKGMSFTDAAKKFR
jgi:regulator of RNase E activity RraA